MSSIIVLMENGLERGRFSTSSNAVVLNNNSIIIGSGIILKTSNSIGMLYIAETKEVRYINPIYAGKNQSDPIIRDLLDYLKKKKTGK